MPSRNFRTIAFFITLVNFNTKNYLDERKFVSALVQAYNSGFTTDESHSKLIP